MALGALKAANFMGRSVPEDLAVVGFDDVPESAYFHPPLSTVRQDMASVGNFAMKELDRLIDAMQKGKDGVEPDTIWIQPQLVIRESSGGANRRCSGGQAGNLTRNDPLFLPLRRRRPRSGWAMPNT
jgi:DNA-binding LacI/PurR family transcriptional regulator